LERNGDGIIVANSKNVEIYGNTLLDNSGGIGAVEAGRSDGYPVTNLWVHDNTLRYGRGWSGIFQTGGPDPYSGAANNRFDGNTYTFTGTLNGPFRWGGGYMDFAGWQDAGQDPSGSAN
jgi:hypothetical protein